MPSTLQQLVVDVYDECQQPDASAPRIDYILTKVRDAAGELRLRAQNVGFNWDARSITIGPGVESGPFLIPEAAADERPTYALTADPSNNAFVPRVIPLIDPQDVHEYIGGFGEGGNVVIFSHWRDSQGALMMQAHPNPLPNDTQCYTIWLENGTIPKALSATPLAALGGFETFLRLKAARSVLSVCEWTRILGADGANMKPLERQEAFAMYAARVGAPIDQDIANWNRIFANYVTSGWEQHTPVPRPYGSWLGGGWA